MYSAMLMVDVQDGQKVIIADMKMVRIQLLVIIVSMISTGTVVSIGEDAYKVALTPEHMCSCTCCQVVNCAYNSALQEFKKRMGVNTCEQLIGVRKHFVKVD